MINNPKIGDRVRVLYGQHRGRGGIITDVNTWAKTISMSVKLDSPAGSTAIVKSYTPNELRPERIGAPTKDESTEVAAPKFIELTDREKDLANLVLVKFDVGKNTLDGALDSMIEAINESRKPDPFGMIRHHAGSHAIRRRYGWLLVHDGYIEERNDDRHPVDVSGWAVIYRPDQG